MCILLWFYAKYNGSFISTFRNSLSFHLQAALHLNLRPTGKPLEDSTDILYETSAWHYFFTLRRISKEGRLFAPHRKIETRQQVTAKRWHASSKLHGVITQKTAIFVTTTRRISYLIFTFFLSVFVCPNSFKNIIFYFGFIIYQRRHHLCTLKLCLLRKFSEVTAISENLQE